MSIGPAPGIKPTTSCTPFKQSTDWANPVVVELLTSDKIVGF